MPYIKPELRGAIKDRIESPVTAGELNYLITTIIKEYWESSPNYTTINDIIGALEGAKAEFYRRVAAPYEDSKIAQNGDVYT